MPAHAPISPAQQRRAAQVNDLLPLGDWIRHHSLRSWPVLLFLVLICVPSIALVILGANPSATTFDNVAWIFAAYFAVAWLLLLGVIIRPEHVTRPMLIVVTVIALVTQVPLAVALEVALHAGNTSLGHSIFSIGIPEELAKEKGIANAQMVRVTSARGSIEGKAMVTRRIVRSMVRRRPVRI